MISISQNFGFAKATPLTFKLDDSILNEYKTFLWNFGDGNFSRVPTPTYTYDKPNSYEVTVNAYKNDGTFTTLTTSINISLFLTESIRFDTVPPPTFASHYNQYPFKVKITSSSVGKHVIDLSTQFSKSYAYQRPKNKWSFLRPEWRFLDINGNEIESIETIDTEIKIDKDGLLDTNGTTVGVTGYAEFYLIDDLYNIDVIETRDPYTTIIATLQTSAINSFHDSYNTGENLPSFSNSKAMAIMPHVFIWRYPDYIDITENGLRGYVDTRWSLSKQPIITKFVFDDKINFEFNHGNGIKLYNPESNFCHYIPYNEENTQTINIMVCGISANITPSPQEINFLDKETGFKSAGYFKGSFEVESVSAKNVKIVANATITNIPKLTSNLYNPIFWVSNPEAGMAAAIQYFKNDWIDQLSCKNLNNSFIKAFDVPVIKPITTVSFLQDVHPLSGFHGVYSIAALPAPDYQAWMCDSENNIIYKFSCTGELLSTINLSDIFYKNNFEFLVNKKLFGQISPACIALDGDKNMWVTLYDTISSLKFDKNGNLLFVSSPINSIGYDLSGGNNTSFLNFFDDIVNFYNNDEDYDINLIEPTGVDTDREDNVWMSYSSPLSGWIVKYDKNGNVLKTISYPLCSSPQEIKCDIYNNIWVVGDQFTLDHELRPPLASRHMSSFIEKRNSEGVLLSSFGPFNSINHLTLDKYENPWFTFGYHWIGTINNINGRQKKLKITSGGYSDNVPDWFNPNENADETALEGIATDSLNNVYVINSIENKIYIIDGDNFEIKDYFHLNPKGFLFSNENYDENSLTKLEFNYWSKSAQAQGDWTGLRWVLKYIDRVDFLSNTRQLTGETNYLNFYDKNPFDFFKINQNHDLAGSMKSIAFQPELKKSEFLFDTFLSSIYGKYPFEHNDLGVNLYEKISNFVSNQSDVDTCDIKTLYDLSQSVDLNGDDFKLNFPLEIRRLMDVLSINQSKLWGSTLEDNFNFKKYNKNDNFNRGKLLKSDSYMVTAGVPVILKTKSLNDHKKIETGYYFSNNFSVVSSLNVGISTYNLSGLAEILNLGDDWKVFYEFYEFIPYKNEVYIDGMIDWNNDQTVLNRNLSSHHEWIRDGGIMDTLFSYELYKGLGLLE